MNKLFILILLFFVLTAKAQLSNIEVDNRMLKIPNSQTKSIATIANYIKENFVSDSNKIRAIFFFTANHIEYDVDNMFAINFNETTENKIEKGLTDRKGVCMHYAEVFNALAKELKFESYVVEGITKQNGTTDAMAHSWNATKVDGSWYLFDATWGSGAIYQGKYIKKLDNQYFKCKPNKLSKSHYPFDYLWQFSAYPLKANDFLYSRPSSNKVKIDYEKLLKELQKLNEIERLHGAVERIEANGLGHGLIFDRYTHLKQMATIIPYNEAVADYNEAIRTLNIYINYRNDKFTPFKTDEEILKMIKTPRQLLELASTKIYSLKNPEKTIDMNLDGLKSSMSDLEKNIQEHEAFVNEYINTKPAKRKGLFYTRTVTFFGIPIGK